MKPGDIIYVSDDDDTKLEKFTTRTSRSGHVTHEVQTQTTDVHQYTDTTLNATSTSCVIVTSSTQQCSSCTSNVQKLRSGQESQSLGCQPRSCVSQSTHSCGSKDIVKSSSCVIVNSSTQQCSSSTSIQKRQRSNQGLLGCQPRNFVDQSTHSCGSKDVATLHSGSSYHSAKCSSSTTCLKTYFANVHRDSSSAVCTAHRKQQHNADENFKSSSYDSSYVKKLEARLKVLKNKVEQLRETEMTLDDMNNCRGAYAVEDKYTKKMLEVWKRLCRIKGYKNSLQSVNHKKKYTYCGSPYPDINDKVMELVNKFNLVPSYSDILKVVRDCVRKGVVNLEAHQIGTLARDVFTEVGIDLQNKRHLDFIHNFGCHLTDSVRTADDPALHSTELQHKLDQNRRVAVSRLAYVIDKYARQQVIDAGASDVTDDSDNELYIVDGDYNIMSSESVDDQSRTSHCDQKTPAVTEVQRLPTDCFVASTETAESARRRTMDNNFSLHLNDNEIFTTEMDGCDQDNVNIVADDDDDDNLDVVPIASSSSSGVNKNICVISESQPDMTETVAVDVVTIDNDDVISVRSAGDSDHDGVADISVIDLVNEDNLPSSCSSRTTISGSSNNVIVSQCTTRICLTNSVATMCSVSCSASTSDKSVSVYGTNKRQSRLKFLPNCTTRSDKSTQIHQPASATQQSTSVRENSTSSCTDGLTTVNRLMRNSSCQTTDQPLARDNTAHTEVLSDSSDAIEIDRSDSDDSSSAISASDILGADDGDSCGYFVIDRHGNSKCPCSHRVAQARGVSDVPHGESSGNGSGSFKRQITTDHCHQPSTSAVEFCDLDVELTDVLPERRVYTAAYNIKGTLKVTSNREETHLKDSALISHLKNVPGAYPKDRRYTKRKRFSLHNTRHRYRRP